MVEACWVSNLAETYRDKALGLVETVWDKTLVMFHFFEDKAIGFLFLWIRRWDLVEIRCDHHLAGAHWDKALGSVKTCWDKVLAAVHLFWIGPWA